MPTLSLTLGPIIQLLSEADSCMCMTLCMEIRACILDNSTVQGYFLNVHTIVDSLASIDVPIPASHHLEVILEGLPSPSVYIPPLSILSSLSSSLPQSARSISNHSSNSSSHYDSVS